MRKITIEIIKSFNNYLINEEKASATINKYMKDIEKFKIWLGDNELCKSEVLTYKTYLCEFYAVASVNSILSSLNCLFSFMEWYDLKVKKLKIQKQVFASAEKELTKPEYNQLLQASIEKKNYRLYLLMQTICSTGIRVPEVKYITVESIM